MTSRVFQRLENGFIRRDFHDYVKSFAGTSNYRRRCSSFGKPTYEWRGRPRQLQSTPLSGGKLLEDSLDPRVYTSGRWLRCDRLECESRYIEFNFAALRKKVIQLCPGAMSIASCEKKEGGFNRVFIFTMDDASRVIARLPTRLSGPPRLTTNSEVATIKYLQSSTTIPIPTVLEWSDDSTNVIGSEYIIMEHAKGVPLYQMWPTMSGEQQIACVGAIVRYIRQMAAIDFQAYGGLYFDNLDLDSTLKLPFTSGYAIGPHCGTTFWDSEAGEPRYYSLAKPNTGPWVNPTAYSSALIDTGFSRLPSTDVPVEEKPSYYGAVAEHIRLLHFGRDVASELIKDPQIRKAAAPILLHPDLHKRNIFVSEKDPTTITDIIDWQSSSINPAFMHTNEVPDFAAPILPPEDHIPSEDHTLSDDPRARLYAKLCNQAFCVGVRLLVPKLSMTWELDDDVTRFFEYCHRTYRDGAGVLRQVLIDLADRWKELALAGSCPYPFPSPEERLTHQEEYNALEQAQELKTFVTNRLNTAADGWVPADAWKETVERHKELYNEFLQNMTEEDLREVWPFDEPYQL